MPSTIHGNPDSGQQSTWAMYRSLLLPVYLPSFFMSVCQGSVLLTIPLFALDLGANAGIAALAFSLRGLGNMVMDVPAGYATARLGDRTTMILGVAFMALAAMLASQATNATELAAVAFLFGGAMATWLIARLTHISETVPLHQRGKAIATMAGIQRLGNLIGPVASGLIAVNFGFDTVFIVVAVIAGIALLLASIFVHVNHKNEHKDSPSIVKVIPHILGRHYKVFASAGLAMLLLTVLRAGRQLLIPLWGESLGLEASDIGLIMGAASAVDMTLFPLAGHILDHWGRRYALISCLGMLSIGLLLIPFTYSFFTLTLAALVIGVGNGLGSGINMTLGADFAPEAERGEFLGVWRLMGDSGSFAGPLLMGVVANSFMLSGALLSTASLGLVGVIVVVFFVKETLVRTKAKV